MGLKVYFFGGLPGVAKKMCRNLSNRFPGLKIAGYRQGYFRPEEERRIIHEINNCSPDIILVAMGVPHQDIWLAKHQAQLDAKLVLGVGGLFDFLSERLPRAPKIVRHAGMEWVFRLIQEPKRMWKRYVIGNPEFLFRTAALARHQYFGAVSQRLSERLQRVLDVVVASISVLGLSPIFFLTALAIRFDSKGPIVFRQTRVGVGGELFTMYKFRSMSRSAEVERVNIDADNHHGTNAVTFKITNDPRVTKVGKFIRKYSIDELPQLFNVLNGSMALVGPRPALPDEVKKYTPFQRRRLAVKPGITCTWQISGRADIPFEKQVEMDLAYINRRSLLRNLKILIATPVAVLTARGAY